MSGEPKDFDYGDPGYYQPVDDDGEELVLTMSVRFNVNGTRVLELRDPQGGQNTGRLAIADVNDPEAMYHLREQLRGWSRMWEDYYKTGGQYEQDNDPREPS